MSSAKKAAQAAGGLAKSTVRRAAEKLGVQSAKDRAKPKGEDFTSTRSSMYAGLHIKVKRSLRIFRLCTYLLSMFNVISEQGSSCAHRVP